MKPELPGVSCSVGRSLENQILTRASAAQAQIGPFCDPPLWVHQLSSSALQPSHLSSTNSSLKLSSSLLSSSLLSSADPSLLSSSSSSLFSSPLLSTENRLLQSAPAPPSLASPARLLFSALAQPPAAAEEGVQEGGRGAEGDGLDLEDQQVPMDDWSQVSEDGSWPGSQSAESAEMDTPDTHLGEEVEQVPVLEGEEFGEVEECSGAQEEELKDKKYLLLNAVCCSLVHKYINPGQLGWDTEDSVWMRIKSLAQRISQSDPEFLLKVAVYTRQELNIRIVANFLLALAAHLPATKPHLRRYFGPAVHLPSDWLEVTRIYSTCFGHSLPSCLKKALVGKFEHFSEYQLAKYNTRKHRCKHNRKRTQSKAEHPSPDQWKHWARYLGTTPNELQIYIKNSLERPVVDKGANVFNLKKMIQRLHIKSPAEHVMPILGKRYPQDVQAFSRSGLKGAWQREWAGQRMKLKQPDTWERSLSEKGNKAQTWEGLIDRKALPFMAMLRNLRNMISAGISEKHHRQILARLTNKESVIRSKQFPFRFLSAYKTILELKKFVREKPSSKDILRGVLVKVTAAEHRRGLHVDWRTVDRKRMKAALRVPFVSRMFHAQRKISPKRCTLEVLVRYQRALEQAIQISCRYNVPPLPGRTLLLCDADLDFRTPWILKQDFCLPTDPGDPEEQSEQQADSHKIKVQEVVLLLAMMIGHCSEHFEMFLIQNDNYLEEVKLKTDLLLDNVWHVMKQVKRLRENSGALKKYNSHNLLRHLVTKKAKVDTIIFFRKGFRDYGDVKNTLEKYNMDINPDVLLIDLDLTTQGAEKTVSTCRNVVRLYGFSEQILRFIGERGSSRLLAHVEHIDKLHRIPPPEEAKDQSERDSAVCSLPATPKLRWRAVRVFVSSTFRDMHGERDLLVRRVFPELRRRAATHCLYLQEVELRWGVTEEQAGRALELCLTHVCRSQLLLGILGERYGVVPTIPPLPQLSQCQWISSAPEGLSITEMEIRQFQALHPDSAQNRMFFYFRTPHLLRSVPDAWRGDFAAESKDAEYKMADLKSRILQSGAKVTEDYPCEWGGVADGKLCVTGLEQFGKTVMEDLWGALLANFIEEVDETEVTEQEMFQDAQHRQCHGRDKLIAAAMKTVQDAQRRRGTTRGVVLVEGPPGAGKTVFMAALANALRSPGRSQKASGCDVISYFTAASQSAQSVEQLLRCLVQWLRRRLGKGEDTLLPTSYKNLLEEFHTELKALSDARKSQPLALLIDGAELIQDPKGQLRFDWIPQDLPLGMILVMSVTPNSTLRRTLAKVKGASVFPLGPLSMADRKEIVEKELAMYGKKLSDSAFNNQLQSLTMKKGSASPLYLHMACEELRNFGVFEKMNDSLQSLPPAIGPLVQQALLRLQSEFRGLDWALSALTVSHHGLRERDLYALLSMCSELSPGSGTVTWQEMLKLARKPRERIPMATFSQVFRTLQCLIGQPYSQGPEDSLTLTNPEVRSAFELLFLSGAIDKARAHSLLAAHLWMLSDPQGKDTFFHCEADAFIHLPAHLMSSGQMAAVSFLLSSFHFLYANVRHGLLHHLLETYRQFEESQNSTAAATPAPAPPPGKLEECRGFLNRHASLLSRWPALFLQQALNEPDGSAPHSWAQGVVGNGRRGGGACSPRLVTWQNKPEQLCAVDGVLVSSYLSKPTCVAVSPGHTLAAVGTENGSLHLIPQETGQEVRSLVSSCDGISGCCFLEEGLLASTSFDGRLEVWDLESGCRTAHVDAHTNRITGCDVSGDKKCLATVSLDLSLKVWSPDGSLVTTLLNPCPLNCVTFDAEGQLLAVGGWDGGVRLWKWLTGEALLTLVGHQQSVRSLSFSPSTSLLSSGSLSGEVRLWAVSTLSCVGCYSAHQGSVEVLKFVERGELLLSAGDDGVVQVWSGGLGEEIAVLKEDKNQPDSCHPATAVPPALCVAVSGCYAAVGYHGDGVKLYNADSGEQLWSSENLRQSVHCLIWIQEAKAQRMESDWGAESVETGAGDDTATGSGSEEGSADGEDTEVESGTETGSGNEAEPGEGEDTDVGSEREAGPKVEQEAEFLITGSGDSLLRVWRRLGEEQMELRGSFGVQEGPILALARSSTHLASASEDFTILLWLVEDLTSAPWSDPSPVSILRGHSGAVTCLSFSPSGEELISGGTDRALLLWKLQPPALSRSLLHCHRDWLTGCAWTPAGSTAVSCSSDGRVCVWDLQKGSCIREIPTPLSLTSLCCVGKHVIGGSREGKLLLWKWSSGVEVSRIAAHRVPIHNCSTLPNTDEENLVVATASDDGTVKLWRPYQVHHRSTMTGHSGGIRGLATRREGVPAFLTVSEDCSLRSCSVSTPKEPSRLGAPTALVLSSCGELLMCGFSSGRVQVWHHDSVLCSKKVSDSEVTALACMPDSQFAVACVDCSVSVWRLVWNPLHPSAQVCKVSHYTLECPAKFLYFCTILLGVCEDSLILNVAKARDDNSAKITDWTGAEYEERAVRVLSLKPNDDISTWLLGERLGEIQLSFIFSMGSSTSLEHSFGAIELSKDENGSPSGRHKQNIISAMTMDRDFVVCGDNKGNIWFNQPPKPCSWSNKKPAHDGRVTVLRLTESTIISASHDRTVKLWDRHSKRQVGVFVCGGPVVVLEVNPQCPSQIVCGDGLGRLYFLSWTD